MKKINVAITINLTGAGGESIWYNGGNQHCVYLYLLLKRIPFVNHVWLCGQVPGAEVAPGMMLEGLARNIHRLDDVIQKVDLLIEMGAYIEKDHADFIHRRNGICVAYRYGNEYIMAVESCSLNAHQLDGNPWVPNRKRAQFDEVWTNPQHVKTCKSFFECLYEAPVKVLSHLWSPYFIDRLSASSETFRAVWPYRDKGPKKRIGIYEPNLNVVKSSIIPMYIADRCYKTNSDRIEHIYITNTINLISHPVFSHLALGLETCRTAVATVDPRYPFVHFAAEYAEFVVSHQFENALNYLFYEALYGGFPLIHNSEMLGDAGYRYHDFDVDDGARVLGQALAGHDANLDAYRRKANAFLESVNPVNPVVINEYADAIKRLFPN